MALAVAYYHALMLEQKDPASYRMMSALHEPRFAEEAKAFILHHIKPFIQAIPSHLNMELTLSNICPYLLDATLIRDDKSEFKIDAQVHVFSKQTKKVVYSWPSTYDPTKQQLYLWGTVKNIQDVPSELDVITDLIQFTKIFGWYCFFCSTRFTGRGTQHRCHRTKTCFACRRPFLSNNFYTNKHVNMFFCDSKDTETATDCEKCNVSIKTKHCLAHHLSKCCRMGYKCGKCQQYTFRGNKFRTISSIKETHLCKVRPCYMCGQPKRPGEQHLCPMNNSKFPSKLGNTAFLALEFSGSTSTSCKDCFENNCLCSTCKDNSFVEQEPILGVLLIEENSRESYNRVIFASPKMKVQNKHDKSVFTCDYLPSDYKNLPLSSSGPTTNFNQGAKRIVSPETFLNTGDSGVIEQLLYYLTLNNLTNLTIMCHAATDLHLEHVVPVLCRKGLSINTVQVHQRILLVETKELSIRFVDAQNYLGNVSLRTLAQHHDLPLNFFPQKLAKSHNFNLVGKVPDFQEWFNFEDDDTDLEKKKHFWEQLPTSWDFNQQLIDICTQKTIVLATACLEFQKEAFQIQELLKEALEHEAQNSRFPYLCPFSWPLFSRAGYAFKLFLCYSKMVHLIYNVKPAITYNSSKGELAFAQYLMWKHKSIEFIHAFSPYGQRRFKEAVPDILGSNKIAYFYNGKIKVY